ncbi:protein-L-isoaspartate(D-aspartate) O-methyltransferase [Massilia sp. CF038]|uniref:protein-L-isoaspartate(D-aspartate) O-methyltransferase n=1 Tax=Massilia sp. CF038 TaxID=1881045 RepID=UPI00091E86CA|nr:protein-L-isoaspartate(D-aspartate) O-methyltransferase [Massilia sp. CF038]SHG53344.1 protein-L-isoaspartate(D-aspartate) O-methyltransferase [Massilia sp. CF038]
MTEKRSTFPLPLSSVTGSAKGSSGAKGSSTPSYSPAKVATPQTATRNAAHTPAAKPWSLPPAPGRAQSDALARGQAQPLQAPRPDLMVSDAIRRAMVQRVAKQGVQDALVLGALEAVPRHRFIDEALSAQAYIDASLPIGHHQTISQPYIVGRMIEVMRNGGKLQRVLEIGTGCGYQAAVLSCVAQDVYSIERIKPLHELAKSNLRPLRIPNIRLHYGDGMLGLPQAAPFDGIILAAAGIEVPQALLEQLTIGGRLVAPVGVRVQHLQLITRIGKSEWTSETLEDCHFVPLRSGTV